MKRHNDLLNRSSFMNLMLDKKMISRSRYAYAWSKKRQALYCSNYDVYLQLNLWAVHCTYCRDNYAYLVPDDDVVEVVVLVWLLVYLVLKLLTNEEPIEEHDDAADAKTQYKHFHVVPERLQ